MNGKQKKQPASKFSVLIFEFDAGIDAGYLAVANEIRKKNGEEERTLKQLYDMTYGEGNWEIL